MRGPSEAPLPSITVGGATRAEGCLLCHAGTRGLGAAHATLGCSPCHGGAPGARTQAAGHEGLEVLAGDLSSVSGTCGQGACHPVEAARVQTSLMARAPGILAVDRFAFGERATSDGDERDDLRSLDASAPAASPAESHARQLCVGCHLGARKERRGDLGDEARGGGCTACHLSPPDLRASDAGGPLHPDVSALVPARRCTGCHARSGRIALSYAGVVELEPNDPRVTSHLEDGRAVGSASADVHAKAQMTCVDCHTERELMGDGTPHRHAHEGLDVACEDCHVRSAQARDGSDADREAVASRLRTAWSRRGMPEPSEAPLRTRAGTPLWRTDSRARTLMLAASGATLKLPAASNGPYHALTGHERLSCQACHASWAPRCTSCHTRLDAEAEGVDQLTGRVVAGRWAETAGGNGFGPPLLAVGPRGRIEPFVEGMTLTIEGADAGKVSRTLFAPLEPHTTGRSRSCASCHAPTLPGSVFPTAGEVTRPTARLLTAAEVARVAKVGRCVACHANWGDSIYRDFGASAARLSRREAPRCKGAP